MVQVLPDVSFGSELAKGLGGGIGAGLGRAADFAAQLGMKKHEMNLRNKLIEQIEGRGQAAPRMNQESFDQQFLSALPEIENHLGRELSPQDLNQLYSHAQKLMGEQQQQLQQDQEDPFRKAKMYAAAGEHDLSRVAGEEAKTSEKRRMTQEEREFLPKKEYIQHAAKTNAEYLNEVSQLEKDMPVTEFALANIEDALGDANKWAAAKDWLAEYTGFAGFRSAAGAELDSGIKNYFLGDLSSIKGGRANVFLEKQIRDAYPKAGQDPISNQKIQLGLRMKEKINRLRIEKARELESEFEEKQGYLPSGFKSIVNKEIRSEVEKIEKDAIKTLHNMSKIQDERDKIFRSYLKPGEVLMMDQDGNPFAVPKKEEREYRERGYIPMGKK